MRGSSAASRRSEEHTSELQSHGLISYAVFCLKKKKNHARSVWPPPASTRSRWRRSTLCAPLLIFFFFFNDTATTEIYTRPYTLSLHDALPISVAPGFVDDPPQRTRE